MECGASWGSRRRAQVATAMGGHHRGGDGCRMGRGMTRAAWAPWALGAVGGPSAGPRSCHKKQPREMYWENAAPPPPLITTPQPKQVPRRLSTTGVFALLRHPQARAAVAGRRSCRRGRHRCCQHPSSPLLLPLSALAGPGQHPLPGGIQSGRGCALGRRCLCRLLCALQPDGGAARGAVRGREDMTCVCTLCACRCSYFLRLSACASTHALDALPPCLHATAC